ncbi:HTH-type transcriptional regulator CatM [Pelagimonas phthalicica]|uniref:HTH-type transcriptional regulator CatM n=1 Tax=Pelagimonas phthalicica TaxID=1037362 RepID=A0A238JHB6_9RHOB|nr:LysR family transcriptional regulator [Pelagimonas phthalicica]TDS89031.1 LysR family transcriptional regulator [Pelagimonas phthalicica]SMX29793.1 HTH-type transcriptional regulator CatM [Pelagimonas phthalicica]
MDWRSVNFDWNRARAFLVTAEEGSLSAAARALGMAQPTLGRQVAALEEELGVILFERVGRGLELTEAGRELLVQAKAMGDAAQAISIVATGQSEELAGEVSISATELYSVWVLPPIIRKLRDIAPGIAINVVSSNEISDLRRREADIAIRNTRPEDPDLIAKSLGNDVGTFFASAEYLEQLGPVTSLADLNKADFIGLGDGDRVVTAFQEFGLPVTAENFRTNSASHFAHWHLAKAGLGLCVGPCAMGDADPDLHRVLPNEPLFEYPVWLVSHRELRTNPRIRLVWDTLRDMLPGLLRGVSK